MICEPCRPVHSPADCIDSKAGREYPWRHCVCQHQPRLQMSVCDVVEDEPEGASADE
jgi:hypothetical protein